MMIINDFWRVDDLIKERWGKQAYKFVDYCGLYPVRPLINYNYFCTPKNSLTFANTGGNGVHFSILNLAFLGENAEPVVMTVPMASINNVIIAEDLEEFFSLGYHVGWNALEQIVYNIEETVTYYSQPDPEITYEQKAFLELIRHELPIKQKPLTQIRLKELEQKYLSKIEIIEG
ncbi:MAG: hypothetical protein ACO1OQ_16225 [Rufibacter sp.]